MSRKALSIFILGLLLWAGCTKDCPNCPECPTCPRNNPTNIDPPYISRIYAPLNVTVGDVAEFSCDVVTDTQIVRYSWCTNPNSSVGASFYFPSPGSSEGFWTPSGTRISLFTQTDSGCTIIHAFDKRGIYNITLEIQDADAYIRRGGTIVRVDPITPDTFAHPLQMAPDFPETLTGNEFEVLRYNISASSGCPSAVVPDSYSIFHIIGYIDTLSGTGENFVSSWIQTGKKLRIYGNDSNYAIIDVDFDIVGSMHLWNPSMFDYAKIRVYLLIYPREMGTPQTFTLFSMLLQGNNGTQAYYLNSHHNVELEALFVAPNLIAEYELWVGVETEQFCSPGAGSAICLDAPNGFFSLNRMIIEFVK